MFSNGIKIRPPPLNMRRKLQKQLKEIEDNCLDFINLSLCRVPKGKREYQGQQESQACQDFQGWT